jgi:hypothetical protein
VGSDRGVAAVVLAAGAGTRLAPLTHHRPKPLCPVGSVALLDHALARVSGLGMPVAVNAHHHADQIVEHLERRSGAGSVHCSVEAGFARGTAGALAALGDWLDGRDVVVVNADAFTDVPIGPLLDGWSGERPRVLVVGSDQFGPRSQVAGALVPGHAVARWSAEEASGLWERCWEPALGDGSLEVAACCGAFVDCGDPVAYLRANALVRGDGVLVDPAAEVDGRVERSVIGARSRVAGSVVDSVVWPGATVASGEHLERAVRTTDGRTLLVR